MMKSLLTILLVTLSTSVWSQYCGTGGQCRSQLVRLDIAPSQVEKVLASQKQMNELALPAIDAFVKSDAFASSFIKDYEMKPTGFPFNVEKCRGDFPALNCNNQFLCSDKNVPEQAKAKLCVDILCSMLKGNQMGECGPSSKARPSMLNFPKPISLKKLGLSPKSVTMQNNVLKACFDISQLELSTDIDLEFAKNTSITYNNLGVRNLQVKMNQPQAACMTAKVDLTNSSNPISQISFEKVGSGYFITKAMIEQSIKTSQPYGLNGYSPATIEVLKSVGLQPLAIYLRPVVEDGIKKALGKVFEEQIDKIVGELQQQNIAAQVQTPADSFVSELGIGNVSVGKYVDLMECSVMKAKGTSIPADHKCLNQMYGFKGGLLKVHDLPKPNKAATYLKEQLDKYEHVTSEGLRRRLLDLEAPLKALNQANVFSSQIKPLTNKISSNQMSSQLLNNVELISGLDNRLNTSFGVSLPEICDVSNPSNHSTRSIPSCPIQAYVDLNEFNKLLDSMYQSGRLCHSGKGDFIPEKKANGQPKYDGDGAAIGKGCLFIVEETPGGMRCFLNGPPELRYDPATQGYKLKLNTKECFRGAVAVGIGKVAGDINFDMSFKPSICGGGDFCLTEGKAKWNVVPGTARFALGDGSLLNGMVKDTINSQLSELVNQTFRLPLSTNAGPMAIVPVQAEGRIDKGDGFFGACLKLKTP